MMEQNLLNKACKHVFAQEVCAERYTRQKGRQGDYKVSIRFSKGQDNALIIVQYEMPWNLKKKKKECSTQLPV